MTKLVRLPGLSLLVLLWAVTGQIFFVSSSSDHHRQEEDGEPLQKKSNLRRAQRQERVRVVIVGAGAAGLGAARELEQNGITDYVILEADNQIGGRTKKDTSFVGYPLDTGASFIPDSFLQELEQISRRPLPTTYVPGIIRVFRDYTYYDVFQNYVKPADQYIRMNCQVRQVDYQDREVQVGCADGRRFVADQAVITVPLSILQSNDIVFTPRLGAMAGNSRDWWGGFKIFIEFNNNFYGDYFCVWEPCTDENSENLFWDYTYSAPSRQAASNLLAGYIVGQQAERFRGLSERQLVNLLLQEIAARFSRRRQDLGYRRHILVNWSQEPFIRGAYSSWSSNRQRGVYAANDQLFFAGEAFPANGEERGWVYSAFHSGMAAATQIAALPTPSRTTPPPTRDQPQQPPPSSGAGARENVGKTRIRVDVMYDKSPGETNWMIMDRRSSRPVYVSQRDSDNLLNWGLVSTTLELDDGRYYFAMLDFAGNGICCSNGVGYIEIAKIVNNFPVTLASIPGNFGSMTDFDFTLP